MALRSFLVICLLSFAVHVAQAQWVMEIYVNGSLTTCSNFFANPSFSVSFNGNTQSSNSYEVSMTLYQSHGNFSGNITANGSGNCECTDPEGNTVPGCTPAFSSSSTTLAVAHSDSDPQTCQGNQKTHTANGFLVSVSYKIYKLMDAPTATPATGSCGGSFTLFSPSVASSYIWEVTDDPTLNNWQPLNGKNAQSIPVTATELNFPGFAGTLRYARVREGNTCPGRTGTASNSFNIYLPAPTAISVSWAEPKCFGYDNGTVTINSITGGQVNNYLVTLQVFDPPGNVYGNVYQKAYASSEFPVTITKATINNQFGVSGIKDGKWRLIVANNQTTSKLGTCSITSDDKTIVQPTDIVATLTPSIYNTYGVKCNGDNNGSVSVSASQGTPGSGYTYLWSNGQTGTSISTLTAGIYSVTVTDANGCTKSPSTNLKSPDLLSPTVVTTKTPSCAESNDGELSVSTTGGAPGSVGYSYVWSTSETGAVAHNLLKGNYSVTVTDANGCTLPKSATLSGPLPIIVTLDATSPTCVGGTNGRVWVTDVQNEPGSIQYLWNTNDNDFEILNVGKETYSVTVSSVNGSKTCTGTASKEVKDPTPWKATISPVLSYNGAAIKCHGESNGKLDVIFKNDLNQVTDGEFYTWSNGESGSSVKFIEDLAEGDYTVTVRYNGICETTASFPLHDPEPVTVTIEGNSNYSGQLISCHNKTDASLKIKDSGGGTGLPSSFSYTWSTNASGTILSGLGAGEYHVTAKDVNGCIGRDTITIDNPSEVEAFILSSSDYSDYGVSCTGENDGHITSGASGGTNVFTYLWSNGKPTAFIDQLAAGDYTVTVSDENGCPASVSHTITSPDPLTLQVSEKQNISCFNGSDGFIVLQADGGASEYQYSKDNTVWQPSATFDLLPIGNYTIYARDGNSCLNNVSQALIQPTQINIVFTNIEPAYCADPRGKATGVVTGGVGNYQYEWKAEGEAQVISTTDLLSNVPAGIYDLFVRDGNDCPADNSVPITSTDGAKTTYSSVDAKCFDSADGSAIVTITEGDGPFTIKWPDNQSQLEGINLKRGTYNVRVTDGHNCAVIQTVIVDAPDPLQLNVKNETIPTCNTFCDGQLTLEADGGVGNYIYEWNNKTGAQQTQLCAGIYPVIVKDGNECTLIKDVELKQPAAITVTRLREALPTCKDGCDGVLEITASGGNGGYQYTWANGGNANIKTSICPGFYKATVTDVKGCAGEETFQLNNTPALPLNLGGGVTLCVGQTYTLDAGTQWVSLQWKGSNGLSSAEQKIIVKEDGQYWLEAFNDKGCVAQDTFLLQTSIDLLRSEFFLATQAMIGDTVVMVDVSWPLPDKIEWNYPPSMKKILDNGPMIYGQFEEGGTYEISLSAHLGECFDRMAKTITILRGEEEPDGGRLGYEKFVKNFELYPNPTDGNFDVNVELAEESEITLSVWNGGTSLFMGKVVGSGKKSYLVHFALRPLGSGTYILRLDHKKGKEYIRFIAH
jgi:hypothetical protein